MYTGKSIGISLTWFVQQYAKVSLESDINFCSYRADTSVDPLPPARHNQTKSRIQRCNSAIKLQGNSKTAFRTEREIITS